MRSSRPYRYYSYPFSVGNRMNQAKHLYVGDWRVDGPGCRIDRDGASVSLEPKVMDLLLLLIAQTGEVASKEDLLSTLWPGMVVGEDTLARTVSKLRSALDAQQCISDYWLRVEHHESLHAHNADQIHTVFFRCEITLVETRCSLLQRHLVPF